MILNDAFRPPWKLLAQLFGELGGISKVGVVDVLSDDSLDPSAHTIRRFALLYPNRPKQFVDGLGLISGIVSLPMVA